MGQLQYTVDRLYVAIDLQKKPESVLNKLKLILLGLYSRSSCQQYRSIDIARVFLGKR